jgi:hypothetical protein
MVDLLYYSGPLIAIGGGAGLLYNDAAMVLSCQVLFVVANAIGISIGALLRRRNGRNA